MLPAVTVQPLLRRLASQAAPRQGALESAMKALYLALGLRMSDAAEVQAYAVFHQPQRQSGSGCRRSSPAPPWHAVVHQHRLRNPASPQRLVPDTRVLGPACVLQMPQAQQ